MATVRKRKWVTPIGEQKEAWVVDYKDDRGKRRSGGQFERKKDADRKLREIRDQIDRGTHVHDRDALIFRDVVGLPERKAEQSTRFMAHCEWRERVGQRMSPGRLNNIRSSLRNHLLPAFGSLKINRFEDLTLVQDWVDEMAEKISPQTGELYKVETLRLWVCNLFMVLKYAKQERLGLKRHPLEDDAEIEYPEREDGKDENFLEADDILKLLRWAQRTRRSQQVVDSWRSPTIGILLAMFAGMRRAECCGLQWDDVNLENWTVDVNKTLSPYGPRPITKSGRKGRRVVPMNPILHAALEQHSRHHGWPTAGYVLRDARGQRLMPSGLGRYWRNAAEEAELVDENGKRLCTFHGLRHTAGSLWLADGMKIEDVSRLLGHSTIKTTWNIYIHKMEHDTRALQAIEYVANRFLNQAWAQGLKIPASQRPLQLAPPEPPTIDATATEVEPAAVLPTNGAGVAAEVEMEEWQQQAIDLFSRGLRIEEIAKEVGAYNRRVSKWLETTGLYTPPRKRGRVPGALRARVLALYQDHVPMSEIIRETGATDSSIRRWAEDAGLERRPRHIKPRRLPQETHEKVLELYRDGVILTEISRRVGVGMGTVWRWVKAAGLSRCTRPPLSQSPDAKRQRAYRERRRRRDVAQATDAA